MNTATAHTLEVLAREQAAWTFLAISNLISLAACFLSINVLAWLWWRLRKYPYIVEDLSGFVQAEVVAKLEWLRPRWWLEEVRKGRKERTA